MEFGCLEGELAVCRGIGDFDLEPGLTPEPFVAEPFALRDVNFVILASDGIWENVQDDEAVRLVLAGLREGYTLMDCANQLADMAIAEGSSDDISVVIVALRGESSFRIHN